MKKIKRTAVEPLHPTTVMSTALIGLQLTPPPMTGDTFKDRLV